MFSLSFSVPHKTMILYVCKSNRKHGKETGRFSLHNRELKSLVTPIEMYQYCH